MSRAPTRRVTGGARVTRQPLFFETIKQSVLVVKQVTAHDFVCVTAMNHEAAETLKQQLEQYNSIDQANVFYVDGYNRVYDWENAYEPGGGDRFGVEFRTVDSAALPSNVLGKLADTDVTLMNSLLHRGEFRTVP